MPQQLKWDPFTGILERAPEAPKTQPPIPPQLTADYADAEEKTKAFLDGVHAKEKIHLTAYELMRENIRNARDSGERRYFESLFDQGHNKTVTQHDESVRNRDTAVRNVWSFFAETWPGTTCKLTTAALAPSGKTYRTVEVESPYLGKKVIGPTKVPEERYMVDESNGGFRPLAREPPGFLPQSPSITKQESGQAWKLVLPTQHMAEHRAVFSSTISKLESAQFWKLDFITQDTTEYSVISRSTITKLEGASVRFMP